MTNLLVMPSPVSDAAARDRALDTTCSFIVEAPAGSGKTGLLIQRYLKLLASEAVDDPAQVLAITFTRKATSEMRDRVLSQLAAAEARIKPANAFDELTRPLAEDVLERDRLLGWSLLDHPRRLNIRTIDSLSHDIAAALPILSGSGGSLSPTDHPQALFAEAARRTLMLLGGDDALLNQALELLLLHRDGNLANCEELIASMLQTREQWGELVPLSGAELDDRYLDEVVLPKLDKALDEVICRALTRVAKAVPQRLLQRLCELAAEMGHLDGYNGNPSPIALCAGKTMPPEEKSAHLEHWSALVDLLLTKSGEFRAAGGINKRNVKFEIQVRHKQQLVEIIDALRGDESLGEVLCSLRTLPPAEYPREQWAVMKALFRVLARALAELQVIFAERGQCDFAEMSLLARTALRNDTALDDLGAASGARLQHLLVDEMQDTSSSQYEFVQLLTRRWDGHSQTVFLVGDPKQSIYLFRQARVERFVRTLHSSQLGDLPLEVLRLTANFRSRPHLVQAFNKDFSRVFPAEVDPARPEAVAYQNASAVRTGAGARVWHADAIPYTADAVERSAAMRAQSVRHAQSIRELVQRWRETPLPAGRPATWKIAVLVRNRAHLTRILPELREAAIPYRAVEIETLSERQEILDLLALTRALLHPADRTAWLALLRGPWCGLSLADLHRLAGGDDRTQSERTLYERMRECGAELSDDGIARLQPFWQVMDSALRQRGRTTLAQWVAETWRAFGTPAFLASDALTNAESYFRLLDEIESAGTGVSVKTLQDRVRELYAAPSVEPDAVDLMTLHKAKGLEWDVVLVPELQRRGRNNTSELLAWLEAAEDDDAAAGILAPIAGKGRATGELNTWMRSVISAREAAERKRLFYVACTRAREELHLFAAPQCRKDGSVSPGSASLLQAAWAAAEERFAIAPTAVLPMPQAAPLFAIAASAGTAATRLIERMPLAAQSTQPPAEKAVARHFSRPEGSFAARAFGNTAHAFLELLAARLAAGADAELLLAQMPSWTARAAAVLRGSGLAPAAIDRAANNVVRALTKTLQDADGRWLLANHPGAASESSLTTWDEETRTIRLDRTFVAGPAPRAAGTSHLWIVDYKTATHGAEGLDAFLVAERAKYAPQLETYARELAPPMPVRVALYYPAIPRLLWWEPNS